MQPEPGQNISCCCEQRWFTAQIVYWPGAQFVGRENGWLPGKLSVFRIKLVGRQSCGWTDSPFRRADSTNIT